MVHVAPSILACDFAHLADECRRAEDAGADALHVDPMDGHFVRNLTIGPVIVEAVRRSTKLPLNVHLMIQRPEAYAAEFCDAGADWVIVHPEAEGDPAGALEIVRSKGVKTGIALNPETSVASAKEFLGNTDFVLIMSINPGWGGQAFMPEALPKLAEAKALSPEGTLLGVDGGINIETGREVVRAGGNFLVAGTFLFRSDDMPGRIAALKALAGEGG
ncbi:MAG: ribulose-phosphate 3-epimerase [Planctomycetota bacterium]|jgi:ribulose-phosphate 3-epimerase